MQRLAALLLSLALSATVGATTAQAQTEPDRDCLRTLAGVDLQTATILELQDALADGRITSEQLTRRYLERIDAFREFNAVRTTNPEALEIARRLDAERAAGGTRGPLHGIPLLLKDNVGTKDMPTTAGSIAMQNWQPTQDAFLTARFREAGAIILGKTNLSEWANWMSTAGMPNGFSSLGGQVKNAFNGGDPSGSSSGSGVAASLALAAGTIGTETSGSILSPAMANSVVGLKTTRGIVSRTGIIPLAEGFDVPGPMVRTVSDAAVMMSAIAGHDTNDRATDRLPGSIPAGFPFERELDGSLDGMVLAYDEQALPAASTANGELLRTALDALRTAGATLVDTSGLASDGAAGNLVLAAIYEQFHANLDHYLATTPRVGKGFNPGSLADVVAYGTLHADKLPYGQDKLVTSLATPGKDPVGNALAAQLETNAHNAIESTLDAAGAVAYVGQNSPNIGLGARAGHPTVFLPLSRSGSSRLGVGFLGRRFSEPQILAAAHVVEQAVRGTDDAHRALPTGEEGIATPAHCGA